MELNFPKTIWPDLQPGDDIRLYISHFPPNETLWEDLRREPVPYMLDAIGCGMDPFQQQIWGIIKIERHNGRAFKHVTIADPVFPEELDDKDLTWRLEWGNEEIYLRPWHIIVTTTDNPLELHWRKRPGSDPQISLPNLDQMEKQEHLNEIRLAIPAIHKSLRSAGGRPPGDTHYPRDEAIRIGKEAIEEKRSKGTSYYITADKYGITEKTLKGYRKMAKNSRS